jgi:uncharacterized protein (TIGR02996 family)
MNDREALLAAIAEAPEDDLPRLAYADWLDEHDDPLGEFIRLQIELEPLKVRRDDPREELQRVQLMRRDEQGLRARLPASALPLVQKLDREAELLRAHESVWLGEVASLKADAQARFNPEFRRGLVASAEIGLSAFWPSAATLRRSCPVLQRLVVIGASGRFGHFAAHPALTGLAELVLAGWLTPADADALSRSPHLGGLRSLTVWVGDHDHDEEVCRFLARMPGLRALTLVQVWGGLNADDPSLDHEADRLAALVNTARGAAVARVERPHDRLFPLDGAHVGRGIVVGHLLGGEPVLAVGHEWPILVHFDGEGRLVREEQPDLSGKVEAQIDPYGWKVWHEEELCEVLRREVSFEPGAIFVREFQAELADVIVQCWPDSPGPTNNADDDSWFVYWWWSTRQFVVLFGNDYWADELGIIHSS